MARSRGRGRPNRAAPAASAPPAGPRLLDLPTVLLEAILLLLPLKLRCRFSTTCRTAHQLVSSSPLLFRSVTAKCRSRMQTLALLRWLAGRYRGASQLLMCLKVQQVPPDRQLQQGLSLQAACLEYLNLAVLDAPVELTGSWLPSLQRLAKLEVLSGRVVLGSSCSQLSALRELFVSCGKEDDSIAEMCSWNGGILPPHTVELQPGSIPAGLTSISFSCCSFPQLPDALCAASGLQELRLDFCSVGWLKGERHAPQLGPTLSSLTGLKTLQLRRLSLQRQDVAALLWHLTSMRHLDTAENAFAEGHEQDVCSGLTRLSALTYLSLTGEDWTGSLDVPPSALPGLHELRLVVPPHCDDLRLPLLGAALHLQRLLVSASSLLCEDNLKLLHELPELSNLAIMLPTDEPFREQLEEGWSQRLVSRLAALPALRCVILVFANDDAVGDAAYDSLWCDLESSRMQMHAMLYEHMPLLDRYWLK